MDSSRIPSALAALAAATLLPWAAAAQPAPTPSAAPGPELSPPIRVLTLASLERLALSSQPQVVVAREQTRIADASVEQLRSPFFPQVTGIAQYSYGNSVRPYSVSGGGPTGAGSVAGAGNPPSGGVAGGAMMPATTSASASANSASYQTGSPSGYWNFSVSGTQLVYDFGQTYGRYKAARDLVLADRSSERATEYQVLSTVRGAYFTARANKELVKVAREARQDQETHLMQVKGFVDVGTQPPIALAQQRAAVANSEVQLISAENNYETAKAQLNQAAGVRGGTDYDVGNEVLGVVPREEGSLEALLTEAFSSRPELTSLDRQKIAQASTVRAIKGAYGPTLSATGSVGETGLSVDSLQTAWSVGALLSWPFFQGGLTSGQVHQAEATLDSLDAQTRLEILEIQLQVDTARLAVRAGKATIGSAEDALFSAREQLRLAEQRYVTGVGSIIELNDAQVAYTTAAGQEVQARYSLASARAQLLAALGRP